MKNNIIYVSYDGILEPLGYSQVVCYIKKLSIKYNITLISYEKKKDLNFENINRLSKELKANNIDWHFLTYHSFPKIFSTLYDIFRGFLKIIYLIYNKKIKIFHCRSYITGIIALLVLPFFKIKIIFDMRGFWIDERSDRQGLRRKSMLFIFFKQIEKYLYYKSKIIITLTHQAKNIICSNYSDIPKEKIFVIPTCADEDFFVPSTINKQNKEIILGYIGSIDTAYNIENIILTFSKIIDEMPNLRLKVYSKNHLKFNFLIKKYNISSEYCSIDYVNRNNIVDVINSFDYGIFYINNNYSSKASFPTKIAELLLCGKPIICNHFNDDISNMIADNNLGIINEFNNYDHNKLIKFIKENYKDNKKSYHCNQFAKEKLSLNYGCDIYNKIYEKISI